MKLYETYASEVADLIRSGVLRPGERLPSVRQAKLQRKISASTVFEAYSLLEARGQIHCRPRSGYYVTERKGPMDALRRSSALVHRAFWWTLGMVTLVTVVFGLAALGMAAALDLVIAAPFDGDAAVVASSVSAFVAGIVVGPLTQIAAALIYMHRHAAVDGRRPAPVPDGLDVRA